jgi:hypothetical protein
MFVCMYVSVGGFISPVTISISIVHIFGSKRLMLCSEKQIQWSVYVSTYRSDVAIPLPLRTEQQNAMTVCPSRP